MPRFRLINQSDIERAEKTANLEYGPHATKAQQIIRRANCRRGFRGPLKHQPSLPKITAFEDVDNPGHLG